MLKNFRISLVFSALIILGLSGSTYAQDGNGISKMHKSWITPLLTKQEIIDGYNAGVDAGATHMLIVWDTWDHEDSYEFVVYNYPGENVGDLIKYYTAPGFYRVSVVFDLHVDFNQQISEKRWWELRS